MSSQSGGTRSLSILIILAVGGVAIYLAWTLRAYTEPPRVLEASAGVVTMLEAAQSGNAESVSAVLKGGGDANARQIKAGPEQGMTALMYAARSGHLGVVKPLIEARASVNAQAADGRTALMYAAMGEEPAIVRVLIEAGANVDARDDQGVTSLMLAAGRGSPDALQTILRQGANLESRNKWGDTALLYAARTGALDKVKALLDAGASVDAANQSGQSALWLAFEPDAVSLDLVAMLIERGARVNQADSVNGVTPLMRAAWRGSAEGVRMLLEKGATKDARDRDNLSAREWAANRGDDAGAEVARLLEGK